MSKTLRNGIYLLAIIIVTGCNTLSGKVAIVKNEIIGKNIDYVITEWGSPSSSIELPTSKGVAYTWNNNGCKSNVTTDSEGIVTSFNTSGGCGYLQW